jgi:Predicted signal transduction protein containing EAL and modified HD-GYP domains
VRDRRRARDLGISYRFLRCINSSFYNLPRTVRTLHRALVLLGLDNLRRLCTLVTLSGFDDRPALLLVDSMLRARMCELLAQAIRCRWHRRSVARFSSAKVSWARPCSAC